MMLRRRMRTKSLQLASVASQALPVVAQLLPLMSTLRSALAAFRAQLAALHSAFLASAAAFEALHLYLAFEAYLAASNVLHKALRTVRQWLP